MTKGVIASRNGMKPNLPYYFLSVLSAVTLVTASDSSRAADNKPNIVYIVVDDLGWKDVGFNGATDIKTPNIDKLAETGARLKQFYAQPMCTPTRAALLTGRYPNRYGLQTIVIPSVSTYGLATDEWLLPQALKEAGYQTAIIGKWHLGHGDRKYWPRQRGFDYQYGPLIGELDYFTHEEHGVLDWYRDNKPVKEDGYTTTLLGDDAVKYINERNASTPFFLYLAFNAPHTPYQAPQEYIDRYKNIDDPTRRIYAGMVTCLDDQIGRVVDALDKRKLRDNTLIIFQSDNGGTRNAMFSGVMADMSKIKIPCDNGPYREGKGTLYEGGTRVCALANWPEHIPAGVTVNEMIHVVDMYPTLAKLAGASTAKSKPLDGLDVLGTISEAKPSPRTEIVYNVEPFRAAIRQGDWKLIWRPLLPSSVELYNIAQDPSEKNNVSAEHQDKVAELQKRIEELAKASTKPLFLVEQFESMQKGLKGEPALPNEDAYYEEEAP
jgi:arylsulfatase A-like enzyme